MRSHVCASVLKIMIYAVIASAIVHLLYIKTKFSNKSLDSLNKSAQKIGLILTGFRPSRSFVYEQLFGFWFGG